MIRQQITRVKCAVTFKFGNEGTLESSQALVLPLGPLKLKIAVVPGGTPFLVSNTLLRALRAIINCQNRTVSSPMLQHEIPLKLSSKGLFLIDINTVALAARLAGNSLGPKGPKTQPTFAAMPGKSTETLSPDQGESSPTETNHHDQDPMQECIFQFSTKAENDANVAKVHEDQASQSNHETTMIHANQDTMAAVSDPRSQKAPLAVPTPPVRVGNVVEPASEAVADRGRLSPTRHQSHASGRPTQPEGGVRRQAPGRELQDSVAGSILDPIHGQSLQHQSEVVPQDVDSLCGTHGSSSRRKWHTDPSATNLPGVGDSESKTSASQGIHAAKGQSHGTSAAHRSTLRSSAFARHGVRMGVRFTDVPAWVYGESSGSGYPGNASPTPEHGECPRQSHPSPRKPSPAGHDRGGPGPECSLVSWDNMEDENTMIHPDVQSLWKHVRTIQNELNQAIQRHKPIGRPFELAEVFCSEQSPLTQQVHRMGHAAFRFGLEQGDLSCAQDRAKLFQQMAVHQPKHVWFSPVCGPWSSWSNFNAARSTLSQQEYLEKRCQMLYQVALGIVLYRHQVQLGRHFHWEQPARSLMFHQPGISEVHRYTRVCQFDLCEVGGLTDPQNGQPMKKGMMLITTSPSLYKSLHGRSCRRNHVHQPIEGQTRWKGQSIRRTQFTEVYPRKFARLIAQSICRNSQEWPFHWSSGMIAMTAVSATEQACVADPFRVSSNQRSKTTFSKSELSHPLKKAEQVSKRRRLDGKQYVDPCHEDCQEILNRINRLTPRVGKTEITDSEVVQPLSNMFGDKSITHVIACRGTDRTMSPLSNIHPDEAPYRKALMILRPSGQIAFETHWERWKQLSHRQLVRPNHACRLNVTMFAKDRESQGGGDSQSDRTVSQEIARGSQDHAQEVPSQSMHYEPPAASPADDAQPTDNQWTGVDTSNPNTEGPLPEQTIRFQSLPRWEQQQLKSMHRNLGHPSNERLAKALQSTGHRPEVIAAARELRCSVCAQVSAPQHQRPGHLKPIMDFNHKVYLDGVKWTNSQGKSFHWFHMLDAGTNFHVAFIAPSRATSEVIHLINQHWICWAGAPSNLVVDAATEFNNEEFSNFCQRFSIRCASINPESHWQMGKAERHGKFVQEMLTKIDCERNINDYNDLQQALNMSTQSKNSLSVRHGYSPEIIVFGKQSRLPGSILSDESIPSHLSAIQESGEIPQAAFRQHLELRELARKAYHSADNSDALRRAVLRRSCPDRGQYEQGKWVMVWRTQGMQNPGWVGPQRVIIQDSRNTVWTTQGGKLYRSSPEHVRRSLPDEGQPDGPELPTDMTMIQRQIDQLGRLPVVTEDEPINLDSNPEVSEPQETDATASRDRLESNLESVNQPDQEPDAVSVPSSQQSARAEDENQMEIQQLLCCESPSALEELNLHDLAYRCEFEVPFEDVQNASYNGDSDPWILLTTSSAKQRTEVHLSELNQEEKIAFQKAKQAEITNWIQTETVSKVLRNQIPKEQILKCRWILTWKPLEDVNQDGVTNKSLRTHKPKARLVVLGYQDPNIEDIPRDSPTLSKTARMLILQTLATHAWQMLSFDVKAAFLQGQPQEGRIMGLEPTSEFRQNLQMNDHEILRLNKGAYGLVDAPYLWYCTLVKELVALGMEVSPFDPCTFVLRDKQDPTKLAGILGVHVDDGIGGGNEQFHEVIRLLEQKYPFGSKRVNAFTFTGIDLTQTEDHSIVMSQSTYVRKIKPIVIEPNRKTQEEMQVNESERGALRGLVGSLQYAAVNTRPDLSSRLSQLQSAINHAKIETLLEANKLLHEAKKYHDVHIKIRPIPYEDFRFMAFSDASFASHRKPDSHAGMIIVGTHQLITKNIQCPISPLSWGSKKIQKVVTSTLSAETTSLASALDQLAWLRLFWSWIHNPQTQWKQPEKTLKEIVPAITAPTFNECNDVAITDCKSLYDLITRTAPPSCSEFRVQLVARAIKDALQEGISVRWVHSGAQLADCLTKSMQCHFLRETLRLGTYKLHDEQSTLKERSQTRDRIKWLKANSSESEPTVP